MTEIYWEVQLETIEALGKLGLFLGLNERLSPLRLVQIVSKLPDSLEKDEALNCLSQLVFLRTQGLEPQHNDNNYGVSHRTEDTSGDPQGS